MEKVRARLGLLPSPEDLPSLSLPEMSQCTPVGLCVSLTLNDKNWVRKVTSTTIFLSRFPPLIPPLSFCASCLRLLASSYTRLEKRENSSPTPGPTPFQILAFSYVFHHRISPRSSGFSRNMLRRLLLLLPLELPPPPPPDPAVVRLRFPAPWLLLCTLI